MGWKIKFFFCSFMPVREWNPWCLLPFPFYIHLCSDGRCHNLGCLSIFWMKIAGKLKKACPALWGLSNVLMYNNEMWWTTISNQIEIEQANITSFSQTHRPIKKINTLSKSPNRIKVCMHRNCRIAGYKGGFLLTGPALGLIYLLAQSSELGNI